MRTHVHTYLYACMHAHTHAHTYTCIHMYTHVCMNTRTHAHACTLNEIRITEGSIQIIPHKSINAQKYELCVCIAMVKLTNLFSSKTVIVSDI